MIKSLLYDLNKHIKDEEYIAVKKGSKDEKRILKKFAKGIKPTTVHGIDIYVGGLKRVVSSSYFSDSFNPLVVNKEYMKELEKRVEIEDRKNIKEQKQRIKEIQPMVKEIIESV